MTRAMKKVSRPIMHRKKMLFSIYWKRIRI